MSKNKQNKPATVAPTTEEAKNEVQLDKSVVTEEIGINPGDIQSTVTETSTVDGKSEDTSSDEEENSGRGMTSSSVQLDEGPFVNPTETTEIAGESNEDTQGDDLVEVEEDDIIPPAPEGCGLNSVAELMKTYVTVMDKKYASTVEQRIQCQMYLRTTINAVLDCTGPSFAEAMKWIISIVRQYSKTVFADMLVFRNFPALKLGSNEVKRFESLISLLTTAASLENPRAISGRVDLQVLFRYIPNNDHQQRLQSFFINE